MMPLPQQFVDLPFGPVHGPRRHGLDHDEPHHAGELVAEDLPLARGQGDQGGIVLITAIQTLALGREHADHQERAVLDAHGLADRVLLAEQVLDHGLPQHHDAGGRAHIVIGEAGARHDGPIAHVEDGRGRGPDHRGPVVGAVDDLRIVRRDGRHGGHLRQFVDGLGIGGGQRGHSATAHADAARGGGPGQHDEQIAPHRGDRLRHHRLRPLPHRQHQYHRPHADDHAEHGQRGAQTVGAHGL